MQKYVHFIMYCGNALLFLHVNYIVYKHFDRSLHIKSSDPTCVQNFRPVPLTVFEILGLNNKKNWRNGLFAISPMLIVQFKPKFR